MTDGQLEFFGDTWEVNLKFVAPLGEIPKEFQVPDSKKPEEKATNKKQTTKTTPRTTTAKINVKAGEGSAQRQGSGADERCNRRRLQGGGLRHVHFKSKSNTKAVCAELTANLKAQGWTNDGSDLITPASSILKRKRGDATLTIFVKPEGGGSEVKIFTEGLAGTKNSAGCGTRDCDGKTKEGARSQVS